MQPRPPTSTLFPYTTLFRSSVQLTGVRVCHEREQRAHEHDRQAEEEQMLFGEERVGEPAQMDGQRDQELDRKSTRLNSSHMSISYAVFCLKKKNKTKSTNEQ